MKNALSHLYAIGPLYNLVTWYRLAHGGMQVVQCTVGYPKQRQVKVNWYELFCFGSSTVQFASQHVRFFMM